MFYNYILCNNVNGQTYNGYTVDLERRLRQHNGELVGGARSTRRMAGHWKFLAVVWSDVWSKKSAMSFEWWVRYPTGKKPRPREFSGGDGRVRGLERVLAMDKWSGMDLKVWVRQGDDEFLPSYINAESKRMGVQASDRQALEGAEGDAGLDG